MRQDLSSRIGRSVGTVLAVGAFTYIFARMVPVNATTAALAFMIYALIRYFFSDVEYVARQEVIQVITYGLFLFAIITNLHRLELTQIVTIALLILGTVISMYALYQFLSGSEHVWHFIRPEGYRRRGSGTFISPNFLACYLAMLLPLALAYTLTGRLAHLHKVLVGYASW